MTNATLAVEVITTNAQAIKNANLKKATATIERLTTQAKKNLFCIAVTLKQIEENEWYKEDGYKNTADYAGQIFGYKHAMTSALIRVAKKYIETANSKEVKSVLADENGNDFTVSQLQELLPLEVEQAKTAVAESDITPDMSTKKIREAVKRLTGKDKKDETPEQEKTGETPEQEKTDETPEKEQTDNTAEREAQEKVAREIDSLHNDFQIEWGELYDYLSGKNDVKGVEMLKTLTDTVESLYSVYVSSNSVYNAQ